MQDRVPQIESVLAWAVLARRDLRFGGDMPPLRNLDDLSTELKALVLELLAEVAALKEVMAQQVGRLLAFASRLLSGKSCGRSAGSDGSALSTIARSLIARGLGAGSDAG